MRPPFICAAFIVAASLFAQQNRSIDEALIFPPSNELLLAAQHGYDAGKDWRIDLAYQPPEDFRVIHACSQVTWEVRVAGPLLLAAMEGRTARIHSQGLPASEDILHSRGTLLFQVMYRARKQDERATAVLAVGSREFHPLEAYVNKVESVPCESAYGGGQYYVLEVRQTFTFGFAQNQIQPDWSGPVTLKVRRSNIIEPLELNLHQLLEQQSKRVRRSSH
jgi:hypothetical protein